MGYIRNIRQTESALWRVTDTGADYAQLTKGVSLRIEREDRWFKARVGISSRAGGYATVWAREYRRRGDDNRKLEKIRREVEIAGDKINRIIEGLIEG